MDDVQAQLLKDPRVLQKLTHSGFRGQERLARLNPAPILPVLHEHTLHAPDGAVYGSHAGPEEIKADLSLERDATEPEGSGVDPLSVGA